MEMKRFLEVRRSCVGKMGFENVLVDLASIVSVSPARPGDPGNGRINVAGFEAMPTEEGYDQLKDALNSLNCVVIKRCSYKQ